MSNTILCPNGHAWDMSGDDESTDGSTTAMVCPVCGQMCAAASRVVDATVVGPVMAEQADFDLAATSLPNVPGYEVMSLLGQGGMGKVFKARHLRLDRIVALKMISSEHASFVQRVRFQAEGQALAKLDHAHIVQIYEVDECNGTPFFSLEYLDGGSLDRKLAGIPQPPTVAAQMMETLARAIHVAHQHGIVHRDLKPANILLSKDGQLKITDFGLAKRLEDDFSQTRTGDILGTPTYMAPEQAVGDAKAIGPLTDVYALGVILYEMLTGRPPFRGVNTLETLQFIRLTEPVPPRQLQPSVPRDLDTICLKCMEKSPAKRYASADAFADDLALFLSHKPIRARRAGWTERLGKWVRRSPLRAALVGVILLSMLALGILGTWSNVRLRFLAERADKRSRVARLAVDELYTQFAEEWLAEEPYKDPVRQQFLEKALLVYQEFAEEDADDPEIRRETALAHFRLGQIHRILNRHARAQQAYGRAIALQEELRDRFPSHQAYRQDLANSHNWLGELFRQTGVLTDAEPQFEKALELQEALLVEKPQDQGYRQELARSHYNLAIVLMDTSRSPAAAKHLARAIGLLDGLHKQFPTVADYRHEWARCYINRGVLNKEKLAFQQAEADYQHAIDLLHPLTAVANRGPSRYRTDLAVAHRNLGNLLLSQKERKKEAHDEITKALGILKRLVDDFPVRPVYQKKLAETHNSLASVLASDRKFQQAESHYDQAREIFERLHSEHSDVMEYRQLLGITIGNLGWLRTEQQDWAKARSLYEQAIVHLQIARDANPKNMNCIHALGNQYQDLAETAIRLSDHATAADTAKALASVGRNRAQDCYYAACFLARCCPLAENDPRIAEPTLRKAHARKYADLALHMLEQAQDAGAVDRLPNEHEIFQELQEDPRLKTLLANWKPKAKS